jgi:outer membrane protein assembly factor BamD
VIRPAHLGLLLALTACVGATTNLTGEVTYAKTAKENFDLGVAAQHSHDYTGAAQFFQYTKSKFPYSMYASLSELALADANFEQDKFIEAIDGYKNFIKDHPTSPKADYAGFQIAYCHYKSLPGDFILFPPTYERDQTELYDAQVALKDFLLSYPHSTYQSRGTELLAEVRKRLARHDMYVANYYQSRGHFKAAAWRYQSIVDSYGDTRFADTARSRADAIFNQLGPGSRFAEKPNFGQPTVGPPRPGSPAYGQPPLEPPLPAGQQPLGP